MNVLIVLITLLSYIPHAQSNAVQLSWSYPFNDSTYRHYRVENARIEWISELGADGFIDFEAGEDAVYDVLLRGDADDGELQIVPLNDNCWRVTMVSDYSTLHNEWSAEIDYGATCYRKHLALTMQ